MLVHVDLTISRSSFFEGQSHGSKFTVTGKKCSFLTTGARYVTYVLVVCWFLCIIHLGLQIYCPDLYGE